MEQPHDQDVSGEELVRLCRERLPGDPRPFRALVARYRDQVINTAYRFLGNPRDAEDVAQEAFIKVYRGYHLNKLGSGGFAGGFAARKPPIFPHLLRRCIISSLSL